MKKAVLFLIFNRPETTQKVFEAIRAAKPPRLYIASDGARLGKDGELEEVEKTRNLILDNIDWKCEVKTLFRDKNLGCRKSVSSAITWFFEQEKDGIILEDDVLPNKSFFKFCEELLDKYANNKKVMHIAGHRYAPNFIDNSSYYFAKIQHCWGWASWADRWKYYGTDLNSYSEENLKKFSSNLSVQKYWKDILSKMQNNEIDSWAYQWAFKVVEREGLCINPSENLVSNIGFGEKGTHTIDENNPFANLVTYEIKEIIHPNKIELDQKAVNYIYQDHYGINFFQTDLDVKNTEINEIKSVLDTTKSQLDTTKSQLDTTKSQLDTTKSQLDTTKSQLDTTKSQLDLRVKELETIYYSRGWRFLMYLRKMISLIIPKESVRRKIISLTYNYFKKSVKFCFKVKGKILSIFLILKNYLRKPKKYKRRINRNSKKIVYIGHSYHNKTKSTTFLIDYLKEFYDVKVVLDESWLGKPFPDLSFVDDSYLAVIFFQLLPPIEIINKIKIDNILCFPMFDHLGRLDYSDWVTYHRVKMINFSKSMHNKFVEWGLESMYIQFFPKSEEFIPGDKDKIFFWQRITHVNINTIIKLFKKGNYKLHLHKAVGPGQEFIQPSKKIEKEFTITYSDWFETKKEMLDVIKQKGIYIAPREYEGIGMSFLEAMAMGKAVVAVNNPTMNEYITDGVNGYLFDLRKPKEIGLSNIYNVQKNAYEFMRNGYEQWEKNKLKIIEFIKK
jgi:glycosyltransferase involved in cell wall biosynthesis